MSQNTPLPHKRDLEYRRLQTDTLITLGRCLTSQDAQVRARLEAAAVDGITAQQSRVLLLLFRARQPMTARGLATEMGVSEVTMSRFIQALEKEGWIHRERNPVDGRSFLLAPTDRARSHFPDFVSVSNAVLDQLFSEFSVDEMKTLQSLAERIHRNLERSP